MEMLPAGLSKGPELHHHHPASSKACATTAAQHLRSPAVVAMTRSRQSMAAPGNDQARLASVHDVLCPVSATSCCEAHSCACAALGEVVRMCMHPFNSSAGTPLCFGW